jgi:hypothetical protein
MKKQPRTAQPPILPKRHAFNFGARTLESRTVTGMIKNAALQ